TEFGDAFELGPLLALGIAQILEPKIPSEPTNRSRIFWIVLKVVLGYLLIGFSNGVNSRYWLLLLLPIVSGATAFGLAGSLVFTLLACAAYCSFLLQVDRSQWTLWTVELALRSVFLIMVGNLANALAEDLRVQSRKYQQTAEQLAEANEHLQQ